MRKAGLLLLVMAAACGNSDNLVVGVIGESTITPFIQLGDVNSSISGRISLRDAEGNPTGTFSEVVIMSDRPGLCDRLKQHPDYFRKPPETYLALILFLPGDNRLGTFIPGRLPSDQGTTSEIIGVKDITLPVTPFPALDITQSPATFLPYITLRDWSDSPGGAAVGSFSLVYGPPPELAGPYLFPFYGKFKTAVCPTLDGTLLP